VPCSSQASYLCEAWSPPCPDGYTWVPQAGNASCFRVRTGGYYTASQYWQSITTAEKTCMEDGTRLASPDVQTQYLAARDWLMVNGGQNEATGDSSILQYWQGYRKINSSAQGIQNIAVVSPWYSNASYPLNISSFITGSTNPSVYPYECMYSRHTEIAKGVECLNNETVDTRALCEYRHCTTISGKYCIFPFKIGNRQYDTCVPFGTADGSAWCATRVDSAGNVLTTDTCANQCPVSVCPVGFLSVLQSCIHISAAHPYDTVLSVQDAENVCMGMGARLFQPRSIKILRTLLFLNNPLFNSNDTTLTSPSNGLLGYDISGNYLAIGISGFLSNALLYRDGSPFPDSLVGATLYGFTWFNGDPDGDENNNCIVLTNKQEFANVPCQGYFDGLAAGLKMSYICEAKPFVTTDGLDVNKSCVFPFKADPNDVWHHSCIYGTNAKVCTELSSL